MTLWLTLFLLCLLFTANCQLWIEFSDPLDNKSNLTQIEFKYALVTSTELLSIDMEFSGKLALADPLEACEALTIPLDMEDKPIMLAKQGNCSFTHQSKMAKAVGAQMLLAISISSFALYGPSKLYAQIPILLISKDDGETLIKFLQEQNNSTLLKRKHAKLRYKPRPIDFPNFRAPDPIPPPPPKENSTLPPLQLPIVMTEWEGIIFKPQHIIEWPNGNIAVIAQEADNSLQGQVNFQILTFDRSGASIGTTEIKIGDGKEKISKDRSLPFSESIYKALPLFENKIGLFLLSSDQGYSRYKKQYTYSLRVQILLSNGTKEHEFKIDSGGPNTFVELISPQHFLICTGSNCQGYDLSGNPISRSVLVGLGYLVYLVKPGTLFFFQSNQKVSEGYMVTTVTLNETDFIISKAKNVTHVSPLLQPVTGSNGSELLFAVASTKNDNMAVWLSYDLAEKASRKLLSGTDRGVYAFTKLKSNNIFYAWLAPDDNNAYGIICFSNNFTIGPKFLIAKNMGSKLHNIQLYPMSDGSVVFVAIRTRGSDLLFMKSLDENGRITSAETVFDGITGTWDISNPTKKTIFCWKTTPAGDPRFKIFLFNETVEHVIEPPTKKYALPRLSFEIKAKFALTLPNDLFIDRGGDLITYSATLFDRSPLPYWLQFLPEILTFKGTPAVETDSTLIISIQGCNSMQACSFASMALNFLFSDNSKNPSTTNSTNQTTALRPITATNNVTVTATVTVATTAIKTVTSTETTVRTETLTTIQTKTLLAQTTTLSITETATVTVTMEASIIPTVTTSTVSKTIIATQTATASTSSVATTATNTATSTGTANVTTTIITSQAADTNHSIPDWVLLLAIMEIFFILVLILLFYLMKKKNQPEAIQLTQQTAGSETSAHPSEKGKEFMIVNSSDNLDESS